MAKGESYRARVKHNVYIPIKMLDTEDGLFSEEEMKDRLQLYVQKGEIGTYYPARMQLIIRRVRGSSLTSEPVLGKRHLERMEE